MLRIILARLSRDEVNETCAKRHQHKHGSRHPVSRSLICQFIGTFCGHIPETQQSSELAGLYFLIGSEDRFGTDQSRGCEKNDAENQIQANG